MTADETLTSFDIDYELSHVDEVATFDWYPPMDEDGEAPPGWEAGGQDMLRAVYRAGLKRGLVIAAGMVTAALTPPVDRARATALQRAVLRHQELAGRSLDEAST